MERVRSAAYQRTSSSPAMERREAEPFDQGLAFLARRWRFSVPDLDPHEQNLLDDFGRGASVDGEVRYRMITLRALFSIAARSTRPEDREGLPELIRREILIAGDGHLAMALTPAFDLETSTTGPADVAQREFERRPSRSTWTVCRDALIRQLSATRFALDAVLMWSAAS